MYSEKELCEKIKTIYPEIGTCGIEIKTEYDSMMKTWTVHLEKDGKSLKTYLEPTDADLCMEGKQCVSLSIEINQLRDSIERRP